MENNFDNISEGSGEEQEMSQDVQNIAANGQKTEQNFDTNYQQPEQGYNTNYQQQYQDNYDYNVGSNTGYNQDYNAGMDTAPMSMGDWILTLLITMIPCVNIVMLFVWAFGKEGNINRRNYCRAQLIFAAISVGFSILLLIIFGATAFLTTSNYY